MATSIPELAHGKAPGLAALSTPAAAGIAILSAAVGATVVNTVIAAIAHAAGVSHGFPPLHFAAYTGLTIIGILAGALGWTVVRARSAAPAALLRRLVPAVVIVSFVPDILVGIGKSQPHTTWGGIGALMLMHLAVAGAAVTAFAMLLPVRQQRAGASWGQAPGACQA